MKNLPAIYDGDTNPILRFRLMNGGTPVDASSMAVELKIQDAATGTTLCTRPGVPVSPKSDGYVDVWLKGLETDWEGAGRDLLIVPKFYMALDANGAAATNVLLNPSFDTGAGTVATDWVSGGTLGPTVYELRQDDPAPPVIFGKCQRIYTPTAGSTAYLTQSVTPSMTLVAGDYVSGGMWTRAKLDTGADVTNYGIGGGYFIRLLPGGSDSWYNYLTEGDRDWTFERIEGRCVDPHSTCALQFAAYDAIGYDIRIDDAFLFNGRWSVVHGDPLRLQVRPRVRPLKTNFSTANFIAGTGGFEVDSNSDGIADGWAKTGTLTYAMEADPDHVNTALGGLAAQKVTLNGSSTDQLRIIYRGKFSAGETWRFHVRYKNSGAVSGSPANGDFGVVLHTEEFDGTYETSTLTGANFSLSSIASYATKFRTLALTADHSVLVCDVNLKTASGATLWLDDAALWRTA